MQENPFLKDLSDDELWNRREQIDDSFFILSFEVAIGSRISFLRRIRVEYVPREDRTMLLPNRCQLISRLFPTSFYFTVHQKERTNCFFLSTSPRNPAHDTKQEGAAVGIAIMRLSVFPVWGFVARRSILQYIRGRETSSSKSIKNGTCEITKQN